MGDPTSTTMDTSEPDAGSTSGSLEARNIAVILSTIFIIALLVVIIVVLVIVLKVKRSAKDTYQINESHGGGVVDSNGGFSNNTYSPGKCMHAGRPVLCCAHSSIGPRAVASTFLVDRRCVQKRLVRASAIGAKVQR